LYLKIATFYVFIIASTVDLAEWILIIRPAVAMHAGLYFLPTQFRLYALFIKYCSLDDIFTVQNETNNSIVEFCDAILSIHTHIIIPMKL